MDHTQSIEFVIGEEKRLTDLLSGPEVLPLLKSAVKAGLAQASLRDEEGVVLWAFPSGEAATGELASRPVHLEGEPVGKLCFAAGGADPAVAQATAQVVSDAIGSMVNTNLKRMLTTEVHTTVVNQSYEELLETNRKLTASEQNYRELAESLEVKVQERTAELKQAYARMLQQEKMASVGQLAAGVAHEINNPLGFILSNLNTLRKYVDKFREMLTFYRDAPGPELQQAAQDRWRELKLGFILEDIDDLFSQSITGAQRVKKIVADLRGFSHIDDIGQGLVDINAELERTLSVLAAESPQGARIETSFGELPQVVGNAAQLCQAFLNIIRNAFQARPTGLELHLTTARRGDVIRLEFKDNGPGMPAEVHKRIFEPFFTTREVGSGMGLGLSVAYDAVTAAGGTIDAESRPGEGTAIIIQLPVAKEAP